MIGTVPVYDSVIHYPAGPGHPQCQGLIDVVRLHAQDGVDFVTLHCGITRKTIDQIRKHKTEDEHRLTGRFPCVRMDVHDRGGESLL